MAAWVLAGAPEAKGCGFAPGGGVRLDAEVGERSQAESRNAVAVRMANGRWQRNFRATVISVDVVCVGGLWVGVMGDTWLLLPGSWRFFMLGSGRWRCAPVFPTRRRRL
jgi:hypothetical protein